LGVWGEPLQQGLDGPGFAGTGTLPEQGGRFERCLLLDERGVKGLLELQTAVGKAGGIARLPGRPAVRIARFELGFGIAGSPGLEFLIFVHDSFCAS